MRACPHCGSVEHELWMAFTDAEGRAESRFDVMRCGGCGLMGLRELPGAAELEGYYQETYYRPGTAARFPAPVEKVIRRFREGRARQVRGILERGKDGVYGSYRSHGSHGSHGSHRDGGSEDGTLHDEPRVLDVGCGRGLMLATLKGWGFEVEGTQLSRTAAAAIREQHGIEVYVGELTDDDAPFEPGSFDVITMLHVLEHVRDPQAYVGRVAELLKPGGTFVVEVPNAASWTAKAAGLKWVHYDIPRHLWHFTPGTLKRLVEAAGLKYEARFPYSAEYAPFGAVQAALNLATRRHALFTSLTGERQLGAVDFAVQVVAAAALTPPSLAWCFAEKIFGAGQILQGVGRRV